MHLSYLETFVQLARLKNFSRTAERLNTTQPSVSARIARLEEHFGARLVERNTRGVTLTPAGQEALTVVERVLGELDSLGQRLGESGAVRGKARIGAIDAIVQTWLPQLIEDLRAAHPEVMIEVIADTTANLTAALREDALDVAFSMEPVLDDGFRNFVLCSYAMAWVASPAHFDVTRRYDLSELAELPIITFPRNSPPYRMIAPYFQDESVLARQLSTSNSLPTMIRLAMDGFGVAAVPPVVVRRELAEGQLAVLGVTKAFPPLPFIASYHSAPNTVLVERVVALARQTADAYCAATPEAASAETGARPR